jgi:hypothetical protein
MKSSPWRRQPPVPSELVTRIEAALAEVDAARAALEACVDANLVERRAAHARLRQSFTAADVLLRQATQQARGHSYREWSRWRSRLSRLDAAWQRHLFVESDDSGVLPVGSSVRAIDTGMSGPDIGDLQYGKSRPPGTPARYGIDADALLTRPPRGPVVLRPKAVTAPDHAGPVEAAEHVAETRRMSYGGVTP